MRKNLGDRFLVYYKMELVKRLYFILLEIQELDSQLKNPKRKIRVVYTYNH